MTLLEVSSASRELRTQVRVLPEGVLGTVLWPEPSKPSQADLHICEGQDTGYQHLFYLPVLLLYHLEESL